MNYHKYKAVFYTVVILFMCYTLHAQATDIRLDNIHITLNKKDVKLEDILHEIENQTELLFVYNKNVDLNRIVSVNAKKETLQRVLSHLFDGTVNYSFEGSYIVLSPQTEKKEVRQQVRMITGSVFDENGVPLAGASIIEKGTTNGIVTDTDGKFTLAVSPGKILSVTYIGYLSQEIKVTGNILKIIMKEDSQSLEEVMVVGYGTQKRVNLTGAVEQVTDAILKNRPMANLTQGLQGTIPNLNISLSDGKPMRSAEFNVRGTTSIGQGGSALVLIDGVEGDPAMLNPNDIASVSVLKDAASASIYGARGAFGVVLITTKNPDKERTSVTYNGNFSVKTPTVVPSMVTDGYLYATMFVEAYSAAYDYSTTPSKFHKSNPYSEDWYNEMASHRPGMNAPEVVTGSDGSYTYYGNTDWYNELYKKQTLSHDHNVTIQGGGEKADFLVSGHFYGQDGLFKYNSDDYKIYNIRAKGSAQILPWLKVSNNFDFSQMNYHNPLTVADGSVWYGLEGEGLPVATMFNPDGTLTMAAAYSIGDLWYGKSYTNYEKRITRNTSSFEATFLENTLRLKGDITFRNADDNNTTKRSPVPYSTKQGVISYLGSSTDDFKEENAVTKYLATNLYAEYEPTIGDNHYLKGMVGYNYEQSTYKEVSTRRNGLIFDDAENINMANGSAIAVNSEYDKWRIAGGFFRLNYAFKNRYLLEVNGRLDGSSKFPSDQQWSFFPSVSGGWRASEEAFWHVNPKVISDVKIRASYGSLGNGNINAYAYKELFSIYQMSRLLNGSLNQQTYMPTIIPKSLTWETATTANFGLDMGSLDGRMRLAADYYIRKTTDMYTVGKTLPAVFGAEVPKGNYADMTTRGWEITLSWHDNFNFANKPFSYEARFTLADYVSKIDRYNNETNNVDDFYKGKTVGEIWGYVTEGFFTSEEDVKTHADQTLYMVGYGTKRMPGDIKFKDLNNDHVINYGTNTLDNPGDRKVIGNTTPRYTFSLNLSADWNNIFVSAFFQGVGKQDWWPGYDNALFWGQYNRPYNNIPVSMLGDIWSEENPTAYFPRYRGYSALQGFSQMAVAQTRYLQNAAYVRLKNLQIGYNLPKSWIAATHMQSARIYLSGENLWSWSPLYKHTKNFDVGSIYGEDTEAKATASDGGKNTIITNGGSSYNYPILRSFTIGLSVTF
ncbi:TonB-dependent receptor [Parabacteroides faecis]|uniref:TonB-dependent receptor n=1 Tax=Parabacteroides TaxID=375288 RepID=UPI000EFEEEA9|nr:MULTISPECIES: TonB-dependent receptor [Parabacteroides]MBC8617042.1 TonB-dependent receptor [Parabacteroides faecis]RHR97980.1 SusC/RagA family TonB-linked outer membrane protein [Parabacteroides sp. AF14-59]